MSSQFTIRCEDCEVVGPGLHRGAGGSVSLLGMPGNWRWSTSVQSEKDQAEIREDGRAAWEAFLSEHEFHDLRLRST